MSISTISSNNAMASSQSMHRMQRPDPGKMADKLFSKLDSTGQGYIEKADLQSAFSNISGASSSGNTNDVDQLFSQLDGDSDGKVTKDEFSSAMKKVTEQLDQQFMSMRMQGGAGEAGGMPPPPPGGMPPGGGMSKDELTSQANNATDSSQSTALNNLVTNFEKADTNQDGKVSMQEAMAYDQTSKAGSADTSHASGNVHSASNDSNVKMMQQIMQLMRAYSVGGESAQQSSTLSVAA